MAGGGDMLADLTGCPNEKANAFLFAAAPDLLQAMLVAQATILRLSRKYETLGSVQGALDVIHTAHLKAIGDKS
jgi:hypothetical protein